MEFPFTVVFEPPSRAELRAVLRMRRLWVASPIVALAIGTVVALLAGTVGHADAGPAAERVSLELTSQPTGAAVRLDGRDRGRTPLQLLVAPGPHAVQFSMRDMVDGQYVVHAGPPATSFDAVLWQRQPTLTRLRPTLPGAALGEVRFLADGDLALSITLPPGARQQAWRLRPRSGAVDLVLADVHGTQLAIAPDGLRVAFAGYEVGPPRRGAEAPWSGADPATMLWTVGPDPGSPWVGVRLATGAGDELRDVSWSPTADRLMVVVGERQPSGSARSRIVYVDVSGWVTREVLTLPSEVVPGSAHWSPDGQHVAFVARAGSINALCVLDLDGRFRYVADLDPSAAPPLASTPGAWSSDSQRLAFVAPRQHPPVAGLGWLQSEPRRTLYIARVDDLLPVEIGDTSVDRVVWQADDQLIGLGHQGADGALEVHLLGTAATGPRLLELPLRPVSGSSYAAAWDLGRARLLVAHAALSGGVEYWLASLGAQVGS